MVSSHIGDDLCEFLISIHKLYYMSFLFWLFFADIQIWKERNRLYKIYSRNSWDSPSHLFAYSTIEYYRYMQHVYVWVWFIRDDIRIDRKWNKI